MRVLFEGFFRLHFKQSWITQLAFSDHVVGLQLIISQGQIFDLFLDIGDITYQQFSFWIASACGLVHALGDVEIPSGNVKLAMSHVVPDLVQKILKGQDPLHILGDGEQIRHYTYAGDLARGIVTAMEHPAALNEDFNLSTSQATTVTQLAEAIWRRINGSRPLAFIHDEPYEHDVKRRVPDVDKARRVLGFEAKTSLADMLDEVIPWIEKAVADGLL